MNKIITIKDDDNGTIEIGSNKIFYVLDDGTNIIVSYDNGKQLGRNNRIDTIAKDSSGTYADVSEVVADAVGLVEFTPAGDISDLTGIAINYEYIGKLVANQDVSSDTDIYIDNFSSNPTFFTVDDTVANNKAAIETQRETDITDPA